MRRTFPVHQVLARDINTYLATLQQHHRRRDRALYMYPEQVVGAILANLATIQHTTFDRRQIKALRWHFKRWLRHPIVRTAPGVYELPKLFAQIAAELDRRLRYVW